MPQSGFIAVLVIDLHFPESGSLKSKRKELSSIKSQLHGRLGVAVSETGLSRPVAALEAHRRDDRRVARRPCPPRPTRCSDGLNRGAQMAYTSSA